LIVALADGGRLPAIYPDRCFSEQGGLTSYGADDPDLYRHAGILVAQILRGAGPGDLPFYQASRFELVVNLKTAKALGLAVPRSLLARADELID
jgi:putative ABC transport system substrate-binding protein